MKKNIFTLFFILGLLNISFALENKPPIEVKLSVDKKFANIGDTIKVTLEVKSNKNIELALPDLTEQLKDFSLVDSNTKKSIFLQKQKVEQSYILVFYNIGKYKIAWNKVKFKVKDSKDWQEFNIPEQTIEIKSLLTDKSKIKDIKGPIYLKSKLWFVLVIILALVIILFFILLFYNLKNKRVAVEIPKRPAHEIAYEQLEDLRNHDYISHGQYKEYFAQVSDIIRHYLENRFSVKAPEMTTEEFLLYVRDYAKLLSGHKELLKEFLIACDLVKFAKYVPVKDESENVFSTAKNFIDKTREEVVRVEKQ